MNNDSLVVHIANLPSNGIDYIPWIALTLSIIAIIWQIISWNKDRIIHLNIIQSGTEITNCILDEHIIILDVAIINTGRQPTTIIGFNIEIPGFKGNIEFLEDPKQKEQNYYIVKSGLNYPREVLVNHKKYDEGILLPGVSISGLAIARTLDTIESRKKIGSLNFYVVDHKMKKHKSVLRYKSM